MGKIPAQAAFLHASSQSTRREFMTASRLEIPEPTTQAIPNCCTRIAKMFRFGETDFSVLSSASLLTQDRPKSQEDALVFCFSG